MKFGRNLPRNQVPEWASHYINYKGLKKLIKACAEAARDGRPADTAGASAFSIEYPCELTVRQSSISLSIEI